MADYIAMFHMVMQQRVEIVKILPGVYCRTLIWGSFIRSRTVLAEGFFGLHRFYFSEKENDL